MERSSSAPAMVRFGIFEADLRSGELRRRGLRVKLQDKPLLILEALLERPGVLVTREELRQRLWPQEGFLEFDDSLNTAVQKLRQALGDSAASPRFVETVPRRGYRFIAPVERLSKVRPGAATETPVAELAPSLAARWPAQAGRLAAAGLALAVVALLALAVGRQIERGRVPEGLRVEATTPLTSAPGLEHRPTWSPDGTRLAYASDQLGQMDVWVSQVRHAEPVVLTRDHPGYDGNPAWSPNGEWIAFASNRLGGGIYVMSPLGGSLRRVAPVDFVPTVEFLGSEPTLTWSPDSRRLAYAVGIGDSRGLFVIAIKGGALESVPLPPGFATFSIVEPAWSPDGERLAFTELGGVAKTVSRIWSVRLDGSGLEPLTAGQHFDRQPIWSADGRRLFFISDRGGSPDIWALGVDQDARPDGRPVAVTAGVGVGSMALSPMGEKVAYSRCFEQSNIWSLELRSGGEPSLADARPLTSGSQTIESVAVSVDGNWVAFDSNRAGNVDIWMVRRDGTDLRQVTRDGAHDWSPSFSPDGEEIVFHSVRDGDRELYAVPVAGGASRRLTEHPAKDWLPKWSPDGELIAFGSDRSGNPDVWVVPARGGEARQITSHPGNDHNPLWRPDGSEILFSSNRSGSDELFAVPVQGGEPRQLTRAGWLDVVAFGWSIDGGALFVWARAAGGGGEPGFYEVTAHEARPLVSAPLGGRRISAALASDGESLYFPVWEQLGDIWLAGLGAGD